MHLLSLKDINSDYHNDFNYDKTDRLLISILWVHFFVIAAGALAIYFFEFSRFYPSPFSWSILSVFDVKVALISALVAALMPTMLRGKLKNHYLYRLIMLSAYMIFSFLLILVGGGSIEMHFYLFGIWTLLTLYCDQRLIWIGFIMMLIHHIVLNHTFPEWLSQYGRNDLALVAYIAFSLPAAFFSAWIAENGRRAVHSVIQANTFIRSKLNM